MSDIKLPTLNTAIRRNDQELAVALLNGGDDPNAVDESGWNALHWAAAIGCRLRLFRRILGRIHDVNAPTLDGTTALMEAVKFKKKKMVTALIKHPKIDVNAQDRHYNYTALHHAVSENYPAILDQLLSDGNIDASLKDKYNQTPLKMALVRNLAECQRILGNHGAPESSEEENDLVFTVSYMRSVPIDGTTV